jgi:predicted porin
MKKTLILALGMTSLVATAYAADQNPPVFQPVAPVQNYDMLPDNLSWHGISFFMTYDAGYAYQSNGRPLGSVVSTLEYSPFTTTRNYTGQSVSSLAGNGLEQSRFGVKIDSPVGYDWNIVGRLDTGFDPLKGTLSNGCEGFIQNAGIAYAAQTSNADSGRCGQQWNGEAYGGLSNPAYGRLTIGRQNSMMLDNLAIYDPMTLSYAFSLLGYSGTPAGSGSTEAARWNNSIKYIYEYGPAHFGAMYAEGSVDGGIFGDSYAGNVGFAYRGFGLDGLYTKEHGAVGLQSAVNDSAVFPANQTLAANISDNTSWAVMAKYTFDFAPDAPAGAYYTKVKAPPPVGAKLTFYAGYENLDQANPHSPVTSGDSAGGFPLTTSATLPDNNAFTTDKVLQIYWAGAKYVLPWGLSFTGAYYHVNQNQYIADKKPCLLGGASASDCAGSFDQVSFMADYQMTKHLDFYAGVSWAQVQNGLASGFPGTPGAKLTNQGLIVSSGGTVNAGTNTSVNTTTVMTGFRIKI